MASNCSFLGITSSMYGARRGYVETSWVRMARWTEDLTLLLEPGERLVGRAISFERHAWMEH